MTTRLRFLSCFFGLAIAPWAVYGQGQPPITCGALTTCAEVSSFIAAITDFRAVVQNTNNKTLTVRLSFRNKLNRPLILGYVQGSGVGADDRGNRYVVYGAQAVRGIGEIAGGTVDSKFVLQPGESSDARFEFLWRSSGTEIFGLNLEMDLTIREINALPGNQIQLGREHALHFTGLSAAPAPAAPAARPGTAPMTSAPAPTTVAATVAAPAPASAPAAPPAPVVDACAGRARCYSTGLFMAEVIGLTPSQAGAYHVLLANVRFRNLTNQPIILAYVGRSAVIVDNYGKRYGAKDDGIKGMGQVMGNQADPQFVLNPGASSNAAFSLFRYRAGNDPVGASYNFDLSIAQLEMLPSQQIRTVREYTVGFTELAANVMSAVPPPNANSVNDAAKKLGDIFKSRKK